ncbi:hypothetical protein JCM5296_000972 [Sporobolomyces johnsonii]
MPIPRPPNGPFSSSSSTSGASSPSERETTSSTPYTARPLVSSTARSNQDPRDDYESDEEPFDYDAEDLPAFFSEWSLEKQLEVCAASGVGLSVSAASTSPRG